MAGVYQPDYLTSADQAVPDWLKIPFLGEPKLWLSLGLVMGALASETPFGACRLIFNSMKTGWDIR